MEEFEKLEERGGKSYYHGRQGKGGTEKGEVE